MSDANSSDVVAYIERHKFERAFRLKSPILEPSLGAEILSIFSPKIRHSPHGVDEIIHSISLVHLEAIW